MSNHERRIACAEALGWTRFPYFDPELGDLFVAPGKEVHVRHTVSVRRLPCPDESIADAFVLVEFMQKEGWYFSLDSNKDWEEDGWDDKWLAQFLNAEDPADELHHQGFGPTPQQAIVSAFLNYVASTKEKP